MTDDTKIVAACRDGDCEAFAHLVNRYRYPVFGLCLGYTGDFDLAEDAAQEAFVAAYLGLHELADPMFFGPWLKRIAINQCRTQWRRARRWQPLDDVPEEALYASDPLPDVRIVDAEKRAEVLTAIDRLAESQRQVLVLFYLEEMPLRRIADFLGISEASAKQRLYRARLTLKEEMLDMIKKTVGNHELPPDFTEQVIKESIKRGQERLSARDWSVAQDVFRKVVDAVPDHIEANRGLGLALGGAVEKKVRGSVFDDEALAREAFQTLTRAFELGATDDVVVKRLARMYSDFGRNREGGQFLEQVAETRTDWRDKVRWLKMAISVYYHSHYRNGEDNKADCVRCHRKMREIVPINLDVRTKLDVWCPAGMALAYPHVGLADEVFAEMDMFEKALDETCSVWDHFYIALIRSNTHRELGQWEEMVDVGWGFVGWANQLAEDDNRLLTPMKTIHEDNTSELKQVGKWVRWHVMAYMLNTVARAEHALGRDVTATFKQIDQVLKAHEAYVKDVQKHGNETDIAEAMRWLGGEYTRAGEAAFLSEQFERTLMYYKKEEELLGKLEMHGPIYRVGALAGLDRVDEAIEKLSEIAGRLVATGQWRTTFETHRAFDAIRDHEKVKVIMAHWQEAEAVGKPQTI